MKKTNAFPVIIVHGFLCWGQDSKLNDFCPGFGMWNGNAKMAILEAGVPCQCPSVGAFNGMWDRACILYAQLTGTRVDFGKAHSERTGTERYGETFTKPLVPGWGERDADGNLMKVNLVGHSFGGPTIRTLINLLAEGSEEERACTDPDDLSPLFAGGKADWVHSCTTLAATHNGVTLPDAAGPLFKPFNGVFFFLAPILSGPFNKFYMMGLDQFGVSGKKHVSLNTGKVMKMINQKEGNIFEELTTEFGSYLTKDYKTYDNIYYFSYYGRRTNRKGKYEVPSKDIWLPLRIFSPLECLYKDATHGEEWQPNDGIVNVPAAMHPNNGEPFTDFVSNEECKPGIWYVMPEEWKDHTSYMGVGETKEDYNNFFLEITERVTDLPVINK